MLKIRQTQMDAFLPAVEAGFEDRIMAFLTERYGDVEVQLPAGPKTVKLLDPTQFRAMVKTGIARARDYGMTWESSLTSFVVLMFMIAPNFDEHPQVRLTLTDNAIIADERIDAVCKQATAGTWEAAKQVYDAKSWGLKPINEPVGA